MLKVVLTQLGMATAFMPDADFSMISDEPLHIDEFRQKTYLAVDEKGTEAAAVTVARFQKGEFVGANSRIRQHVLRPPLCILDP